MINKNKMKMFQYSCIVSERLAELIMLIEIKLCQCFEAKFKCVLRLNSTTSGDAIYQEHKVDT